jgi:phenylpyruvate tautomerase PptA (4-oxalocrotonate tautomerase family)
LKSIFFRDDRTNRKSVAYGRNACRSRFHRAPLETIRVWIQKMPPREFMAAGVLAADRKR